MNNYCASRMYLTISLLFIIVGVYCAPSSNEYEGSRCQNGNLPGRCKPLPNCPIAEEAVRLHRVHNFHRCGFHGATEIVCCPKVSMREPTDPNSTTPNYRPVWGDGDKTTATTEKDVSQNRNTLTRRCIQACDELSNFVKPMLGYHIIDGEDADLGEFPHMAALGYKKDDGTIDYRCGATLISSRYLVTAAHCLVSIEQILPSTVRMGVIDITLKEPNSIPQDYNIVNTTIFRRYNYRERQNDIALIKIDRDVVLSDKVHPACLYTAHDDPKGLIVTGWGSTTKDGNTRSNRLLKATLTPVPVAQCNDIYQNRFSKQIIKSQICAIDNTSDACAGDSGGPLQVQNRNGSSVYSLVGITSYGINCGGRTPGVYTRISQFLDWIEEIVWGNQ